MLQKMDNSTAIFYANRMALQQPGTPSLGVVLERNVSLVAEHLPGVDNYIANEELFNPQQQLSCKFLACTK